jgi:four helix bundle protein
MDATREERSEAITAYRDLRVWQAAMDLAALCYGVTREFPRDEMYGMTSQIRRASVSVATNIAEGHGRESTGSFVQFPRVSQGSLKELETPFLIANRVGVASKAQVERILDICGEVGRMLRGLIRMLQRKSGGAP